MLSGIETLLKRWTLENPMYNVYIGCTNGKFGSEHWILHEMIKRGLLHIL